MWKTHTHGEYSLSTILITKLDLNKTKFDLNKTKRVYLAHTIALARQSRQCRRAVPCSLGVP